MKEKLSVSLINNSAELRGLALEGWIKALSKDNKFAGWEIQQKAHDLLQKVESAFSKDKVKKISILLGEDAETRIKEYNEVFPKIKFPSGKAARSDYKNLESAFEWFFKTHNYSWGTILEATKRYVDEYQPRGFMYCQTARYFIRKQASDKTWSSALAEYCATVDSGQAAEEGKYFKETVV